MLVKIEGLVLNKVYYQERHVIAKILLRNGAQVSVLFYGGRGGGKKAKSSTIELGYMLSIEAKIKKEDFLETKEWNVLWAHQQIRYHHSAFFSMCQSLELITKINHPDAAFFNLLSNFLFSLDLHAKEKNMVMPIFLTKLIGILGVFPNINQCISCGEKLESVGEFAINLGGFRCPHCYFSKKNLAELEWWMNSQKMASLLFKNQHEINLNYSDKISQLLIAYIVHHFHLTLVTKVRHT